MRADLVAKVLSHGTEILRDYMRQRLCTGSLGGYTDCMSCMPYVQSTEVASTPVDELNWHNGEQT